MRFRNDLPYLLISLTSFQAFDHGQEIEETVPKEWDIQSGDRINWECAQFDGTAEIVECRGGICVIRKAS
jgi:hypothetical protein